MQNDGGKPAPQYLRRDFLVGVTAGFVATQSIGRAVAKAGGRFEGTTTCFSQSGEDVIVRGLLEDRGIKKPSYLDIGAFLPKLGSNTYLLYRNGGRGVLVEPNVDLTSTLRQTRPKDVVLDVGIGLDGAHRADYYQLNRMQFNSFDGAQARKLVEMLGGGVTLVGVVPVRLMPINQVLSEHFFDRGPDFLSIDVEGLDLAILKTMDFDRFRPSVVCRDAGSAGEDDGFVDHGVPEGQRLPGAGDDARQYDL